MPISPFLQMQKFQMENLSDPCQGCAKYTAVSFVLSTGPDTQRSINIGPMNEQQCNAHLGNRNQRTYLLIRRVVRFSLCHVERGRKVGKQCLKYSYQPTLALFIQQFFWQWHLGICGYTRVNYTSPPVQVTPSTLVRVYLSCCPLSGQKSMCFR